jgi:hypothetical protein
MGATGGDGDTSSKDGGAPAGDTEMVIVDGQHRLGACAHLASAAAAAGGVDGLPEGLRTVTVEVGKSRLDKGWLP